MDLISALKSGKPFKSPGKPYCINAGGNGADGVPVKFSAQEILADDWEIVEPKVTITRGQFFDAVAKVVKAVAAERGYLYHSSLGQNEFDVDGFKGWTDIAKELGL